MLFKLGINSGPTAPIMEEEALKVTPSQLANVIYPTTNFVNNPGHLYHN